MSPAAVEQILAGFRVRRYGQGRHVALLVHGAMLSAASWEPFQKALGVHAPSWTSVAVDLPGFGLAPDEPWDDYGEMAERLATLVSQLRTASGKLVVVGHSMGGGIALTMLRDHGEVLNGMVVMDSGLGQSQGEISIGSIVGDLSAPPAGQTVRTIVESWFSEPQHIDLEPLIRDAGRVNAETFAGMLAAIRKHDLSGEVSRFPAIPLLLLRGSRDRTRTASEMQALSKLPGRSDYVEISGSGHCPHIEDATVTALVVASWLARI
ncbi:alpha/beta fold hydrolase [Neoaquamicrobium sediminum]|uniref:Alpha/beta hydrolase n=1 Tax=Neoaquamicrobium sediminum TaxID=1849104 RepID=A0ABV3WXR2_9HYPH